MRKSCCFGCCFCVWLLLLMLSTGVAAWAAPQELESETVSDDLAEDLADFEDDPVAEIAGPEADDSKDSAEDALGDDFEDDFTDTISAPAATMAAESDAADDKTAAFLSRFELDGYVEFGATCNVSHSAPPPGRTDWRGLSELRTELQLELDGKLSRHWRTFVSGNAFHDFAYAINGRDDYTAQVLKTYENEVELRKAYVEGRLTSWLDMKVGRQIEVWGRSDNIRVTDVLNPLDIRQPGKTDIEEIRLPLFMSKLDFYWGDWNVSGIAVHENRYNKTPVWGSDFFPYDRPLPEEEIPDTRLRDTELAAALTGIFSGWDVSFYYADYFDDEPYLALKPRGPVLSHARLTMTGAAMNFAMGNWLLKAEGAWFDGIRYGAYLTRFGMIENTGLYSRLDTLAGVEYTGLTETTITVEAVNRHVPDFDPEAELSGARKNVFQTTVRVFSEFMNQTLHVTALASIYGSMGDDGAYYRLTAVYDVVDNLELTAGAVLYQSGDLPSFSNIADSDRVYCNLRYNF